MSESAAQPHERAFSEFARRATERFGDRIHELILYGSTVRGETRGRDSDVDVFLVLDSREYEDELRDIAYDVALHYGVVVSLHVEETEEFETQRDHPFIKNVLREGRSYG